MIQLPSVIPETMESFTLANGHRLGFVEWGDPDDFPAFYNHGTPGSRLEGSFADFAARRHGFRLIAVDRPGSGGSTFQPARPRLADVVALADLLRGSDLASSAVGGPHLFACGVAIDPERLRFIGALGPWV